MAEQQQSEENRSSSSKYECPFDECKRSFTRLHDLKRHWLSIHKQTLEALADLLPNEQKPLVCPECGHSFTSKDSLKTHQEKLHGTKTKKEGRFKCPYPECSERAPYWQVQPLIKHCQETHNDQFGKNIKSSHST